MAVVLKALLFQRFFSALHSLTFSNDNLTSFWWNSLETTSQKAKNWYAVNILLYWKIKC
jgi:hypothetical protein